MKKNYILLILIILTVLTSCIINTTTKKRDSIVDFELKNYIGINQTKKLDNCIKEFDFYLSNEYENISKEERIKTFLNDIYHAYTVRNNKSQNLIYSLNYFKKCMDSLESTSFFHSKDTTMLKNDTIFKIERWREHLFYSQFETKELQDVTYDKNYSEKITLHRFEDNKISTDYYYGIYKSANENSFIKKWIQLKMSFSHKSEALVYLMSNATLQELNSPVYKIMIFTEFILPFYNHENQKFELESPAAQSL